MKSAVLESAALFAERVGARPVLEFADGTKGRVIAEADVAALVADLNLRMIRQGSSVALVKRIRVGLTKRLTGRSIPAGADVANEVQRAFVETMAEVFPPRRRA